MWFHVSDDAVLNHWTESHQGQPNRLAFSIISCKFFNQILFYWNYWYYCVFILHSEILFTGRCCFGTRERRSWFSTKAGTIPAICQRLNIIAWSIINWWKKDKEPKNAWNMVDLCRSHEASCIHQHLRPDQPTEAREWQWDSGVKKSDWNGSM